MKKNNRRHTEHQSISDVLKEFVSTNNLEKGIDQVEITEVWKRVMGPGVVSYTTNIQLKRNVLYIQLSSSVLRDQLSYGISKIIVNINEAMGKQAIDKIVLR